MVSDTQYAYPYDPNGVLPENIVSNELHTLTPVPSNLYNFIVPKKAPFFRKGLRVVHELTNAPLIEGQDYWLGHELELPEGGKVETVYTSITFVDPGLAGTVRIESYRTLGGDLVLDEAQILLLLAQNSVDPRTVEWEDVIGPVTFPPDEHDTEGKDLVGLDNLVDQLNALTLAIHGLPGREVSVGIHNVLELSQELFERANIRGQFKSQVGIGYPLANSSGKIALRIPIFHSATRFEAKYHLISDKGYTELTFKGTAPGVHDETESDVWDLEGSYQGQYAFNGDDRFIGAFDSEGHPYIAIDIGETTKGIIVNKDVVMETNIPQSYIDGWSIDVEEHDLSRYSRLKSNSAGNLLIDFNPEVLRDVTYVIVNTEGNGIHELPTNVPNGTTLHVKDTTAQVSGRPQEFKGSFLVNTGARPRLVDGVRLDKNLGWFKCQFYTGEVLNGFNDFWVITEGS